MRFNVSIFYFKLNEAFFVLVLLSVVVVVDSRSGATEADGRIGLQRDGLNWKQCVFSF